jgi:dTDP-glucose pyrophosphorylase
LETLRNILIAPDTSILKALEVIDVNAMQIALIVDAQDRLLGTVTDGDVRRGILRGIPLEDAVHTVMNPYPTVARIWEDSTAVLTRMKLSYLHQIPILNEQDQVVDIKILSDLLLAGKRDNWVVLMAGGLGTRLAPLTQDRPKPLLEVGGKPLLETILESFIDQGFHRFFLSVNYKAEMIIDHFGDGARWGVEIRYLREDRQLGTAGALSLLPECPTLPLLVMNGDLLTKVNFRQLLDFHQAHQARATMCVREYNFQVPYGVVRIAQNRLIGIDEKPLQKFFVSAGIYVLDPLTLDRLSPAVPMNMPDLFEALIAEDQHTVVFPIREYWLDIGQMEDFKRANGEYPEVFK